jgi:hypothetical protein
MSLTSFLRNKDVHERFRKEFIKPRLSIKKDILAPSLSTDRARLVGTAFDYLFRFYLQHLNPNAVCRRWIAEEALTRLATDQGLHKKGQKIIEGARKNVNEFLKSGRITDELIRSSVLLAGLDPIVRAGVGHENIGLVYKHDVQDLRNLIGVIEPRLFKAKKLCLLNPTFGEASLLVGGADADIVIDDTIIDIKTTKNLACLPRDFHQLVGYYVLHQVGSIGELKSKLRINKFAVYFSRFAYLHIFEVKEIVESDGFPKFVKWFETRARKEYKNIAARALKTRSDRVNKSSSTDPYDAYAKWYTQWTNKKGESLWRDKKSGDYFIVSSPRLFSGGGQAREKIEISKAKATLWLKKNT